MEKMNQNKTQEQNQKDKNINQPKKPQSSQSGGQVNQKFEQEDVGPSSSRSQGV
jgi:hypothetical protein